MKKNPTRKLALSTTVVAVLSDELRTIAAGRAAYTKASVCAEQCCVSDYCGGSSGC